MVRQYLNARLEQTCSILGIDLAYFIKGGFWLAFSISATTLAGVLLSSLFARVWPKDVYGQFSFLMTALGFLSVTALPGMGLAVIQAVSEGKEGTYRLATKISLKWSLIGALLLICGSIYFYFRSNQNLALAVFLAALAFPFNASLGLYSAFLNGKKDFKLMSIFSTSTQLIFVAATAFALWRFSSLILVTLAATWSTAIANSALTFLTLQKLRNTKMDFKLIKLGKTISLGNVMTIGIDYFDRFAIPLFLGFSQNATYAIAILIPMQIQNFLKVSMNLAQPKLVEVQEKQAKKVLIAKSFQLEIPIALMVIAYFLAAPYIFKILYPNYPEAVKISQIFVLILLYYPSNLFGLYLVKKRAVSKALASSIIYVIASVCSLLIFLWLWGLIGAVFSKIFAKIVQAVTTQIFFNSELALAKDINDED